MNDIITASLDIPRAKVQAARCSAEFLEAFRILDYEYVVITCVYTESSHLYLIINSILINGTYSVINIKNPCIFFLYARPIFGLLFSINYRVVQWNIYLQSLVY